jgi:hypothetical protein
VLVREKVKEPEHIILHAWFPFHRHAFVMVEGTAARADCMTLGMVALQEHIINTLMSMISGI